MPNWSLGRGGDWREIWWKFGIETQHPAKPRKVLTNRRGWKPCRIRAPGYPYQQQISASAMHIESIPIDIGRRRQELFELKEAVTLTPAEYEVIFPWVSNWYTNEKANSFAPRFNTQRTNYRCIFHAKRPQEPGGKGIRARSIRAPLENPCPFTMGVVAHYDKDAKITKYIVGRTSISNRCPDRTHSAKKLTESRDAMAYARSLITECR